MRWNHVLSETCRPRKSNAKIVHGKPFHVCLLRTKPQQNDESFGPLTSGLLTASQCGLRWFMPSHPGYWFQMLPMCWCPPNFYLHLVFSLWRATLIHNFLLGIYTWVSYNSFTINMLRIKLMIFLPEGVRDRRPQNMLLWYIDYLELKALVKRRM